MNVDEYQKWTRETAIYPAFEAIRYPLMGLVGEIGEIMNKVKKVIRNGPNDPTYDDIREPIKSELGDAFYYFARLADDYGFKLSEIMEQNKAKLEARKDAGLLSGSGEGLNRT